MKRWFYTLHLHTNTVSVFSTDEYGPTQGYETEEEALVAALKGLEKEMRQHSDRMSASLAALTVLNEEYAKINNRIRWYF